MPRPTRRPPPETPLYAPLLTADAQRLVRAGWTYHPIGTCPWWVSPDRQGMYTEAEALAQLEREERAPDA
jgi:hypothetical protein